MPPGAPRWRATPSWPTAPPPTQRLRLLTAEFLRDKEFHGAQGFVITDEVALAIAAQAVLPVLHLKGHLDWYDDFVGIVVHPSEVVARRKVVDEAGSCTSTTRSWPAKPWTAARSCSAGRTCSRAASPAKAATTS
jgi:Mlc titration factor MtfA (ptsG expression regulator)